jgi:drug/metabolite transporter (DMT)-like permease
MNTSTSPALAGAGLVVLSAVLWGTVGIASKLLFGMAEIAPLTVGFYRLAIAAPSCSSWPASCRESPGPNSTGAAPSCSWPWA